MPSRWSFAHRHRLVGTVTPLRHRAAGGLFAPQLTYPRSSWEQGSHLQYTPTGPAPFAPVAAADCKGAHNRVSDRAVDRPCSRLIRPQGPHPRTAAWRASLRRSHAAGCCWFSDTQAARPARSRRLGGSVKATLAGKYVPNARQSKRAAHTPPNGQTVCCCAVHMRAGTLAFGLWVQTPQPVHEVTGKRG